MKLNTDTLEKACYELARSFRPKIGMVNEVLARAQVDGYMNEAIHHEQYLIDQDVDPNFLVLAVRYLTMTQAIPPLEGNLEWFRSSLDLLVELGCPNSIINAESDDFFKVIEHGIAIARSRYEG